MSNFKKLLLALILILIIEIILIYTRYKSVPNPNSFNAQKPKITYILTVNSTCDTLNICFYN